MKILFVGFGSIAKKHLAIIKKIDTTAQFFSISRDQKKLNEYGIIQIKNSEIKKNDLDAIIISNPSFHHCKSILDYFDLKLPMMVEKPVCINIKQYRILQKLSLQNSPLIYNACNLRFHPLIVFFKDFIKNKTSKINEVNVYCGSYLPNWRKDGNYTSYYSSNKELGGGVDLDLIHEIDYVVYLFGFPKRIEKSSRKVSKLKTDSDDFTHYLLIYENFSVMITLNYYRIDSKRYMEVVMDDDTLYLDFIDDSINSFKQKKSLINVKSSGIEQSYFNQMKYFISLINNKKPNLNGLHEALEILKLAL